MSPGWSDWRTDTAERTPLPAVPRDERDLVLASSLVDAGDPGETRSLAPVVVPGDPPRPPRFRLYADEPTASAAPVTLLDAAPPPASPPGGGAHPVPRGRPLVPLVAAAVAVALAAGTGVWLGSRPEQDITTSVVSGEQRSGAAGQQDARTPGQSRDQDRAGRDAGEGARDEARRPDSASLARRDAGPLTSSATATAPSTAPPNEDLAGRTVSYAAPNMLDGRDETAWRMVGDGRGTVLTFTFPRPVTITTVGLLNGYAKGGSTGGRTVDWYAGNRRVRQVEWYFDDGSRVVQSLQDTPQVQRTDVRPRTTSTLRLRLARVSGPGGGPDRRDYTAISEVALEGVPRGVRD